MRRGWATRVAVPIVVVGLVAVLAAATIRAPIASAIRHLFEAATPARVLLLLVAAFAAVVATAVGTRLSGAGPRGHATRRMAALADRVSWPVSVSVQGAIAGVAWYSLGHAMAVPHVFADELIHGEAARNLALHGSLATHGYGFVTPAIDSVAFLVTSNDVAAHEVMQAINVFAVVAAAFLAYPLARRALSPGWALVVAGLTLTVPWIAYARFVLTEPDFYPVFLLFALALVRALERPSLKRQLLVLAALLLTYLTRTQAVVLAGAIVVAVPLYGLARGHVRETLKAFAATWALYLLGAVGVAVALAAGLWSARTVLCSTAWLIRMGSRSGRPRISAGFSSGSGCSSESPLHSVPRRCSGAPRARKARHLPRSPFPPPPHCSQVSPCSRRAPSGRGRCTSAICSSRLH
jgi:hypothetical protein